MLDDSALFTLRLVLLVGAGVAAANGWGVFPGAAWSSRRLEAHRAALLLRDASGDTRGAALLRDKAPTMLRDTEAATATPTPTSGALLRDTEAATTTPTPTPTPSTSGDARDAVPTPTTIPTPTPVPAAAAAAPLMEPLQIRHANLLVAGLATCQMLMGLCLGGITATGARELQFLADATRA